jgi:type IV secretory pathway VirB10-like protein
LFEFFNDLAKINNMVTESLHSFSSQPLAAVQQSKLASVKGGAESAVEKKTALPVALPPENRAITTPQAQTEKYTATAQTRSTDVAAPVKEEGDERLELAQQAREEKLEAARKEREAQLEAERKERVESARAAREAERLEELDEVQFQLYSNLHELAEEERSTEDLIALRTALVARIDLYA